MKTKNNPTGYYVIYKEDGLICSFQRKPDGSMQHHDHYKTALNALRKLGANDGFQDGWFIVSSVALARAKWAE
jgi:hypothetical protein